MLHRHYYIENAKVLADSGTVTVDINVRDPITALWIRMGNTNGGSYNKANLVADCLSKIELIDGGNILWSLNGYEAFALACYRMGVVPYALFDEVQGDEQTLVFPLMFGRYLGDPQYAFNPAAFQNPQIRVQWNMAAVNAVGATGFLTGYGRLTVIAEILEGAPAPSGMFIGKEHYSFTTASSGVTYIDLPIDYPYRALMVRSYKASSYVNAILTNVKLNCDQGKYIGLDESTTNLLEYWSQAHGPFVYKHQFYAKDGDTIYPIMKFDEAVAPMSSTAGYFCGYGNAGYGSGRFGLYSLGGAAGSERNIATIVYGFAPFGHVWVPLGEPSDPEDWFPAPSFKSVRLELTNGTSSGTGAVVIEQVRPY